METTVFLIRHGVTAWHAEGRVLGQRDIPLSETGIAQAEEAAAAVRGVKMSEVLSSPLQRAIQTAEIIGQAAGIEVARDPRLIDFQLGKWTGMTYEDVAKNEEYQRFVQQPDAERIPGGESLEDVRRRAVSAVDQALADNATGDALAIVTHAGIIRVLITHYMGSHPANYHRVRVSPGSISILGFSDDRQLPRVLAVNLVGSVDRVLRSGSQHA